MKLNRIITILLLLGLSASTLFGQEVMTLKDCMRYAVENSSKVKLQELEVDDARVARRDAILKCHHLLSEQSRSRQAKRQKNSYNAIQFHFKLIKGYFICQSC